MYNYYRIIDISEFSHTKYQKLLLFFANYSYAPPAFSSLMPSINFTPIDPNYTVSNIPFNSMSKGYTIISVDLQNKHYCFIDKEDWEDVCNKTLLRNIPTLGL